MKSDIQINMLVVSIYEVYHWIQNGRLDIQPFYARNRINSNKFNSRLIDSVLRGIPVGMIVASEDYSGKYTLIDGGRRINAILDFFEGKYKINLAESPWYGYYYDQLPLIERRKFQDYKLPFHFVRNINEEECCDLFMQINGQTQKMVKKYELRNLRKR